MPLLKSWSSSLPSQTILWSASPFQFHRSQMSNLFWNLAAELQQQASLTDASAPTQQQPKCDYNTIGVSRKNQWIIRGCKDNLLLKRIRQEKGLSYRTASHRITIPEVVQNGGELERKQLTKCKTVATACLTVLLLVTTAGNMGDGGLEKGRGWRGRSQGGGKCEQETLSYMKQQGLWFILENQFLISGKRHCCWVNVFSDTLNTTSKVSSSSIIKEKANISSVNMFKTQRTPQNVER